MDTTQHRNLKAKVGKLTSQLNALKEKQASLIEENRKFQKALKDREKLLEEIPGGVMLIQDEKIIFSNKRIRNQLGYTEEELSELTLLDLVQPNEIEYVGTFQKKLIFGKNASGQLEINLVSKNGKAECCEVSVKRVSFKGKRAFLFNLVSVEERKKIENERCRAEKRRALTRMAGGLGREIEGFSHIIEDHRSKIEVLQELPKTDLDEARRQDEEVENRWHEMCRHINCLARIDSDTSQFVAFDLRKIIHNSVASVKSKWESKPDDLKGVVHLKTYLRGLSPIMGDPKELKRVFMGMILNAYEALPNGGEAYVTTEENSGFANIYIQDNGVGIAENIVDQIFDPFFSTKGSERLGLGLSLAQAGVRRHGGEIEVMSREGEGAAFTIKLPLSKPPPSSRRKKGKKLVRGSHILVISEVDITIDLLIKLLESKGAKISIISTGSEGLKLMKKKKIDLVLIDLKTPYLRPLKLISKIKEEHSALPTVLINSDESDGIRSKVNKFEIDTIIERPLDMKKVLTLVSRALTKKR